MPLISKPIETPREQKPHLWELLFFSFTLVILFGVLVFAVYTFLPVHNDAKPPNSWGFGVDWKGIIQKDTLIFLSGRSPYAHGKGLIPPWAYLLLTPIAILPKAIGSAVIFVLTYAGYAFTLYRLGAKLPVMLLFLACPLIWINAQNGNIDWLAVMGFGLPPQIGLFFVLIKPQIGTGIAIFWISEAWRKGKLREVIRISAPVTVAYLVSFIAYGLWPLKLTGMTEDAFNSSIFPYGVPVALFLLWLAITKRKSIFAMSASPFFAPYINIHSYAVTLFVLDLQPAQIAAANILLWLLFIVT